MINLMADDRFFFFPQILCECLVSCFSHVQFFLTLWTVACQAPLSRGFSRQESWSGLPFPPPGDLPNPGIKPGSPALQVVCLLTEPPGKPLLPLESHIKQARDSSPKETTHTQNGEVEWI